MPYQILRVVAEELEQRLQDPEPRLDRRDPLLARLLVALWEGMVYLQPPRFPGYTPKETKKIIPIWQRFNARQLELQRPPYTIQEFTRYYLSPDYEALRLC